MASENENVTSRLFRATEMRQADAQAVSAGIPGQLLMEAAGQAVAQSTLLHFPGQRHVLVLCGKGNNGGDGYVAARHLLLAGCSVTVLELPQLGQEGDAATARAACLAHLEISLLDRDSLEQSLAHCDLVIDALFGSGLSRPLQGQHGELVQRLNESGLPVVAVDVPSGVAADSPTPPGQHVRAALTVQLAGAKVASAFEPARSAYGRQEVVPIGIPARILQAVATTRLLSIDTARGIPQRPTDAHKYQVGTVLVLAGSPRYLGAAELACRGAYRAGAGLVTLAAEARLSSSWPEIVFQLVDWEEDPLAQLGELDDKRGQAVVAGPGLDERAQAYLPELISTRPQPWVLDAGALNPSDALHQAVRAHGGCVLTPHGGEAARLLAAPVSEVNANPLGSAARIASEWNAICVLKGGTSVVASPGGSLAAYVGGHGGMATGGTGDVLSGVIGAYLAAGGAPLDRVEAAVTVHGRAGGLAQEALGNGLVASDVVERIALAALDQSRNNA